MKLMTALLGFMIFSASAKMPGFDIYLGDLVLKDQRLKVSHDCNPSQAYFSQLQYCS